jgi:hypothetical protein
LQDRQDTTVLQTLDEGIRDAIFQRPPTADGHVALSELIQDPKRVCNEHGFFINLFLRCRAIVLDTKSITSYLS